MDGTSTGICDRTLGRRRGDVPILPSAVNALVALRLACSRAAFGPKISKVLPQFGIDSANSLLSLLFFLLQNL